MSATFRFMKAFNGYDPAAGVLQDFYRWRGEYGDVVISFKPVDASTVMLLDITADVKGEGDGSQALDWLCRLADTHGVRIVAWVERIGHEGLTKAQLTAWYRRHGFTVTRKYGLDGKYASTDIERVPRKGLKGPMGTVMWAVQQAMTAMEAKGAIGPTSEAPETRPDADAGGRPLSY